MDDKPFDKPVRIMFGPLGPIRLVTSTKEAAAILSDTQWPGQRGARHRDAVDACLKVLDGHRSTADARDAFIEAARAADILVSD